MRTNECSNAERSSPSWRISRVVVEPDPGLRRQPVPLVEREPDRVPERREHERGVDRERRQQVEVADPPRRAGRLDAVAASRRRSRAGLRSARAAEAGSVICSARLSSCGTSSSRTGSSSRTTTASSCRHQLLDRRRDRVVHRRRRPVEVRDDRVLLVRLRPRVVDLGVEARRGPSPSPSSPVSWPLFATTCIDELLVMKLRYVAAASAFFDFELIAHGSPSPPSVASALPFARRQQEEADVLAERLLQVGGQPAAADQEDARALAERLPRRVVAEARVAVREVAGVRPGLELRRRGDACPSTGSSSSRRRRRR